MARVTHAQLLSRLSRSRIAAFLAPRAMRSGGRGAAHPRPVIDVDWRGAAATCRRSPFGGWRAGWNEVVIDPSSVVANLPYSVRAVFYTDESDEGHIARSRAAHAELLRTFYPNVSAAAVPLVVFSKTAITEPRDGRMPFVLAPKSSAQYTTAFDDNGQVTVLDGQGRPVSAVA